MKFHDKDVLTTGEVAKICNVAARTVSKWFDSGQIQGYRIDAGYLSTALGRPKYRTFLELGGSEVEGGKRCVAS